jgi:signal peptidase I
MFGQAAIRAVNKRSGQPRLNLRRWTALTLTVLVVVVAWAALAPRQLGGAASYVTTDGSSMLPAFHAGGLVVTRTASNYEVGDVVAYHNQQLHAVVMHRIVALDGSRYIFKGDNNSFRDTYHPTKSELIGKQWIYWPNAGRYVTGLRAPLIFALCLVVLTLVASTGLVSKPSRRRRRHHAW